MLKAMHCSLFNYGISFDVQVRPSPYLSGVWHPECSDSEYLISLSSSLLFLFTLHICVLPFVNPCLLLCASQTLIPAILEPWRSITGLMWINFDQVWHDMYLKLLPELVKFSSTFVQLRMVFTVFSWDLLFTNLVFACRNGWLPCLTKVFLTTTSGRAFCVCLERWALPSWDKYFQELKMYLV